MTITAGARVAQVAPLADQALVRVVGQAQGRLLHHGSGCTQGAR
jgi:hypothetical protein